MHELKHRAMHALTKAVIEADVSGESPRGEKLTRVGYGLNRPECVLTHASGHLFAADWDSMGGVAIVAPDGRIAKIAVRHREEKLRPNGIGLEADGSFLIAHLGDQTGGLFTLKPDGTCEALLETIDGWAIPPSNFPLRDGEGRIWLSVSTQLTPRAKDYRPGASSGLIIVIDKRGARVVAEGLAYANEMAISDDGRYLYVNETFGRRLTRFTMTANGSLVDRTLLTTFASGDFPDGVALDENGELWITSIVSNRVIRIDRNGHRHVEIEDSDPDHLAWVEAAFIDGTMGRPHLDQGKSRQLRNISSLAFGGDDLRTAYLGCLLGDAIFSFRAPVAGQRPLHFDFNIEPLLGALSFA